MHLLDSGVRETPLRIGPGRAVTGILTEPPDPAGAPATVFLFLNAGLLHRVGPSRMHVWLARHLGAAGIASLRFDLSGLGDSAPPDTPLGISERSEADVRDAIDQIEALGWRPRLVLFGLGSGGDLAFEAALDDPRVNGIVTIDGDVGRTWRFWVQRYMSRTVRRERWRSLITGLASLDPGARRDRTSLGGGKAADVGVTRGSIRPKKETALGYQTLVDRGVGLLQVYTGVVEDRDHYRTQFLDAFGQVDFKDRLTLELIPETDPAFTSFEAQRRLMGCIDAWLGHDVA